MAICGGGMGKMDGFGDFIVRVGILIFVSTIAMSPWLGAWSLSLSKAEKETKAAP
jgi:hypothetical protein